MISSSTKPNISIFFPVYNDERTIRTVTEKSMRILKELAHEYEILIIDDCSPDKSGAIADELARQYPCVRVIHHPKNLGYGMALRTAFTNVRYEWVCFTDGDDEYDVADLRKLARLRDYYDLIITFRYVKIYSTLRIFISSVYNRIFRFLFRTNFRDISTGLRFIRKELLQDLNLISTSPFIGAEITIRTMLKGYRIGEVGIQTFPREFGKGSATSFRNIIKTISDMAKVYREIFSPHYELPHDRPRNVR